MDILLTVLYQTDETQKKSCARSIGDSRLKKLAMTICLGMLLILFLCAGCSTGGLQPDEKIDPIQRIDFMTPAKLRTG